MLTDHGATAELVASLAQGLADHVADLRRRVPGATIVTQLDEPTLPAVLEGSLRTASGYRTVPPVETTVVERDLRAVLTAAGGLTAIHCCAPDVPLALLRRTGVSAVAVDMSLLDLADSAEVDRIAEHIDSGVILMAGVLPRRRHRPVHSASRRRTRRQTPQTGHQRRLRTGTSASGTHRHPLLRPRRRERRLRPGSTQTLRRGRPSPRRRLIFSPAPRRLVREIVVGVCFFLSPSL
ncbi:uroporphyrinogen decarboxylase/cobalamine-independent methonine synthase family protein [Fodinicola feengrottensis]|uniref:hypothetical protein n=1 Tax=Fodinicola feengrottensis TaxID=435914 RepID=UPI0024419317|nr:hypothetical protein [Fodinicola feengrottensis]